MYEQLKKLTAKPELFQAYTARDLWTDEHISKKMLQLHLDANTDLASRNPDTIDETVKFLSQQLAIDSSTSVIDFGCGPGLYASKLARTGAEITGVDFSSRSIEYAREKAAKDGQRIEYILADYLSYESGKRFDVAMLIYCDLCPLSESQRQSLLSNIRRHLKENGRFVFDVFSLAAFKKRSARIQIEKNLMDGFWAAADYYGVLQTFLYEDSNVVLDKYDIFKKDGEFTVYNWLKYFDLEEIGNELESAGFEIESYYSNLTGADYTDASDETGIIARKV
jgi:SAM-dependent methyltransferase